MEKVFNEHSYKDGRLIPKFRIIVLGSKEVGKTSLLNQYLSNNFREEYNPTKNLMYIYV